MRYRSSEVITGVSPTAAVRIPVGIGTKGEHMALAVSISDIKADGQQFRVAFNLTPSGSYSTGGDTVDFTKATQDAAFQGMAAYIDSSIGPVSLDIWDAG